MEIVYGGIKASDYNIYPRELVSIPAPRKKTEEIYIPGKGNIYVESEDYEQTEINVTFNYIGKEEDWGRIWRKAKSWLLKAGEKLQFSDDPGMFYRISKVEITKNERPSRKVGIFEVTFTTKDGLSYLEEGVMEHEKEEVKQNPYEMAKPVYKIYGNGECALNVNGKKAEVEVQGSAIIDTERMLTYRDEKIMNTAMTGKYEDLYLRHGENEIEITQGFELKIIPNWRCK